MIDITSLNIVLGLAAVGMVVGVFCVFGLAIWAGVWLADNTSLGNSWVKRDRENRDD